MYLYNTCRSVYQFRKIINKQSTPPTYHHYCMTCKDVINKESLSCSTCNNTWCGYFTELPLEKQLKTILSSM